MAEENNDIEGNLKLSEENVNYDIKRNLAECEQYDKSLKVIVLGDSAVGKSSLINRIKKKIINSMNYLVHYQSNIIHI